MPLADASFPASMIPLLQDAASFASRKHRHQLRRDGKTPYAAHLWRVSLTVGVLFGCDDATALLASMLHDTIEDTTTDYEDIQERFGPDVAACVACLTKNMALPEAEREAEYDRRLEHGPWQARLVKLADAYDNLCDVHPQGGDAGESWMHRLDKALSHARRALAIAQPEGALPGYAHALDMMRALIASRQAGPGGLRA